MDDPGRVRGVDRQGHIAEQNGCLTWRQRTVFEPIRQASPTRELKSQKRHTFALTDLEDLHDVRMLQTRDRLSFGQETTAELGIGEARAADHFQGHDTLQLLVHAAINDSHRSLSESALDAVRADGLPDPRRFEIEYPRGRDRREKRVGSRGAVFAEQLMDQFAQPLVALAAICHVPRPLGLVQLERRGKDRLRRQQAISLGRGDR